MMRKIFDSLSRKKDILSISTPRIATYNRKFKTKSFDLNNSNLLPGY